MKKILVYTILFLLISTGTKAQELNLGDIMGEAQEFFGEAQKKADTEAQKKFEAAFKDKFKRMGAYLEQLDNYSAETKCTYMIFKYQMSVDSLIATTAAEKNCKRKYDLYGMQLMSKISSTSIMYCTEDLYNLFSSENTKEEKEKINQLTTDIAEILDRGGRMMVSNIFAGRKDMKNIPDIERTFLMFYAEGEKISDDSAKFSDRENEVSKPILAVLLKHFHPISLLRSTAEISKQMDKIKPCAQATH
ncbi:hypothetical protein ACFQZW_12795 [Lutibacter aestuarii]|uniref:DUF3347 domain-containing protein n=1 Tax=Lutibacter aestuarii TaxID=861111 RepID=A0ABW2Z825_9FLAO